MSSLAGIDAGTNDAVTYLRDLAEAVRSRGLTANIHEPSLTVQVVNPMAGMLRETISVGRARGRWWFVWSWSEPVTRADDPATAAERIAHVLTPMGA